MGPRDPVPAQPSWNPEKEALCIYQVLQRLRRMILVNQHIGSLPSGTLRRPSQILVGTLFFLLLSDVVEREEDASHFLFLLPTLLT